MRDKTWYEVFVSDKNGTRTLEIFDTLPDAKRFKKDFKTNGEGELHIDKWRNIENPVMIQDIE